MRSCTCTGYMMVVSSVYKPRRDTLGVEVEIESTEVCRSYPCKLT